MIPRKPPRVGQVGYVYSPPFRVQGVSIAGEQTMVQIPELDVAFDIGLCPRVALASPMIALSHCHMDHLGGLPYYFSQRVFQGMTPGRCACHASMEPYLRRMLESWHVLEDQRTPFELIPMNPGDQIQIKPNIFLRAMEVSHTVPALGYAIVEYRTKLREEFLDLPQERLRELKEEGTEITRTLEIPLIAYTGDTEVCPALFSDEFRQARIVIAECTFFDSEHERRARVGKHLHVNDLADLLTQWRAETVVLTHISRRTNIRAARERLRQTCGELVEERVRVLMDHRGNSERYERQREDAMSESA